jgi:hypothetical protein
MIVLVDFLPHRLFGGKEREGEGLTGDGLKLWVQAPEFFFLGFPWPIGTYAMEMKCM